MTPRPDPAKRPHNKKYLDLILRPELQHLHLNFENRYTWIRILPAITSGSRDWFEPIAAHEFPGGRFVHPAYFDPNRLSVFDVAFDWFKRHDRHALCSKSNRTGYRLWPAKLCAFWAIKFSERGSHSLKIVLESNNQAPLGLGGKVALKVLETDENGHRMSDALHPKSGVMICVERQMRKAPHAPLDWVEIGRVSHRIDELLKNVAPLESSLLCPLEQVFYHPTVEEQWEYLGRLISPKLAERIRSAS